MTRSAPLTPGWNRSMIALLVIGSNLWFAVSVLIRLGPEKISLMRRTLNWSFVQV
jgi:hypothetical protein